MFHVLSIKLRYKLYFSFSISTSGFPHFYYMLGANLGLLLYGEVSVMCCKSVLRILLNIFLHSVLTMSLVILTISDIIPRLSHLLWNLTAQIQISRRYRKRRKKENDIKDHFQNVEFISKYLYVSSCACNIFLCSIEAKQNYTGFRFPYLP